MTKRELVKTYLAFVDREKVITNLLQVFSLLTQVQKNVVSVNIKDQIKAVYQENQDKLQVEKDEIDNSENL